MNGSDDAQWVELFSCIQLDIFSSTVRILLSTPPLLSECLGLPVTNTVPGHSVLISVITALQNCHRKEQLLVLNGAERMNETWQVIPLHLSEHVWTLMLRD